MGYKNRSAEIDFTQNTNNHITEPKPNNRDGYNRTGGYFFSRLFPHTNTPYRSGQVIGLSKFFRHPEHTHWVRKVHQTSRSNVELFELKLHKGRTRTRTRLSSFQH